MRQDCSKSAGSGAISSIIGKAAAAIKEFYLLPVDDKLLRYQTIAVNTIVKNKNSEVSSCDIPFSPDMEEFNRDYLINEF